MNALPLPQFIASAIERGQLAADISLWSLLAAAIAILLLTILQRLPRFGYVAATALAATAVLSDGPIYRWHVGQMCTSAPANEFVNTATPSSDLERLRLQHVTASVSVKEQIRNRTRLWNRSLGISLLPSQQDPEVVYITLYQPRLTRVLADTFDGVYFFNSATKGCALVRKQQK